MKAKISANQLNAIQLIVAAGSVDGVLTSAAMLHNSSELCKVVFTQAFDVKNLKPEEWQPARTIAFVDLAVNNSVDRETGERTGFKMTLDFVQCVLNAGHTIVAICDEHDADLWAEILQEVGINPNNLLIQPVSQKKCDIGSSGALLSNVLEDADYHTKCLCLMADAADHLKFIFEGDTANRAIKSDIKNNDRRIYMAHHYAQNTRPDNKILGWVVEYEEIECNHEEILSTTKFEKGIIYADTFKRKIDASSFFTLLYKKHAGTVVACIHQEAFVSSDMIEVYSFGVNPTIKNFDVLAALQNAGIKASGFSGKANVLPEDFQNALSVVQKAVENYLTT